MEIFEMELWDEAGSGGEETRMRRGPTSDDVDDEKKTVFQVKGLAVLCCDWPSLSTPHFL